MAELKPFEVVMRIDFASSNKIEVVAHAERVSELVRCRDCKYRDGDYCHHNKYGYAIFTYDNDFCSRGERRNDA